MNSEDTTEETIDQSKVMRLGDPIPEDEASIQGMCVELEYQGKKFPVFFYPASRDAKRARRHAKDKKDEAMGKTRTSFKDVIDFYAAREKAREKEGDEPELTPDLLAKISSFTNEVEAITEHYNFKVFKALINVQLLTSEQRKWILSPITPQRSTVTENADGTDDEGELTTEPGFWSFQDADLIAYVVDRFHNARDAAARKAQPPVRDVGADERGDVDVGEGTGAEAPADEGVGSDS
jgi:hypothetical protein